MDLALVQTLSDEELLARLYKPPVARESRPLALDDAHIHYELRHPGVTLQLLGGVPSATRRCYLQEQLIL